MIIVLLGNKQTTMKHIFHVFFWFNSLSTSKRKRVTKESTGTKISKWKYLKVLQGHNQNINIFNQIFENNFDTINSFVYRKIMKDLQPYAKRILTNQDMTRYIMMFLNFADVFKAALVCKVFTLAIFSHPNIHTLNLYQWHEKKRFNLLYVESTDPDASVLWQFSRIRKLIYYPSVLSLDLELIISSFSFIEHLEFHPSTTSTNILLNFLKNSPKLKTLQINEPVFAIARSNEMLQLETTDVELSNLQKLACEHVSFQTLPVIKYVQEIFLVNCTIVSINDSSDCWNHIRVLHIVGVFVGQAFIDSFCTLLLCSIVHNKICNVIKELILEISIYDIVKICDALKTLSIETLKIQYNFTDIRKPRDVSLRQLLHILHSVHPTKKIALFFPRHRFKLTRFFDSLPGLYTINDSLVVYTNILRYYRLSISTIAKFYGWLANLQSHANQWLNYWEYISINIRRSIKDYKSDLRGIVDQLLLHKDMHFDIKIRISYNFNVVDVIQYLQLLDWRISAQELSETTLRFEICTE